ncbi:GDSL-type esterase/lipase family protein [Sporosarcina sp. 179-K 3D1 HS]|uniref:GDSL-type esterase/lipase family protein n=1 Tax=Sporosarcina sp. 179-K 3D1 HS TaxID=3232169 RepID=UPI00399F5EB1
MNKIGGIDFVKTRMQAVPSAKRDADYYFTKKSVFENSVVQQPDKVFIGDSITDYGEFQEYFPDEVVLNRGIRNDVAKGVLERIEEVVSRNSVEAYLMVGVNDIRYATDIQEFEENIMAIINAFDGKGTKLFIQSILPVNNGLFGNEVSNKKVKEFNDILQRIAEENGLEYIDLHAHFQNQNGQLDKRYTIDGLHLNGDGYKLWIDTLSQLK